MTMERLGSLLPLAIFITLVAGCIWFVRRSTRQREARDERLHGTGGWLGFYLVVSFVLSPLFAIGTALRNFSTAEDRTPALLQMQGYISYKAFCWCLLVGVLAWQFWMANRLRTKYEPGSLTHAKRFLAISPFVMVIGDTAAAWAFLAVNSAGEEITQTVHAFLSSLMWFLYFTYSKRVKNTYLSETSGLGAESSRVRPREGSPNAARVRREPVLEEAAADSSATASASLPPETEEAEVWHYAEGERRSGPVSSERLEALLKVGTISSRTLVWREGRLAWRPLEEVTELNTKRTASAPLEFEPSFVRDDKRRERTGGTFLWLIATILAVLSVWFGLAFHLPDNAHLSYALGIGLGALLLPAMATGIFALWSDYASQRVTLMVFIGACAVVLTTSGGSTLISRGYAQRLLYKDSMSSEDFRAQAVKCSRLRDLRCEEASWREYVRIRPEDPVGLARLGFALNIRDKHEEAIVHLKKAIDLGAGAYDLFAFYADSHNKLGHTSEAIEWSYKTLSVAPGLVDVRGKLAGLLLKANKPYEALSLLQGYDSQLEGRGQQAYFTAQRISIETAIDHGTTARNEERMALRLPVYAGHFFAPVVLGSSKPMAFMVDTGASLTSLSEALLRNSKATYRVVDSDVRMTVADGRKVQAKGVMLDSMKVGPFELKNVPAVVCADCVSLLGQASLSNFDMQSVRAQGVDFLLLAKRGAP